MIILLLLLLLLLYFVLVAVNARYKENLVALVIDEAHCVKTWGERFRTIFLQLGDLRSIVSAEVKVMALTATATKETFEAVTLRLCMENPTVISAPPDRGNIKYNVFPAIKLEDICTKLYKEFKHDFPKTIIFVRRYSDCSNLYSLLRHHLGSFLTDPPCYPCIFPYRRVEMFTSVLTKSMREQLVNSFCTTSSKIKLMIATSAFGLGIDIPDVRRVIHWGIPSNLDEYVQETGRAGRDGLPSIGILHEGKSGKYVNKEMKAYVSNKEICRRKLLFKTFLLYLENDVDVQGCNCCDVCELTCDCSDCSIKE